MKLHNQIVTGLVAGAATGVTAHALAPDAAWLAWITDTSRSRQEPSFYACC